MLTSASGNSWAGFYYDGRTADRQPVTVTLPGGGLHVARPDGTSVTWPIGEVRQTQGSFSKEQLRLEFGTDPVQVVFVNDPGLAQAVRRTYPDVQGAWRERRPTTRLLAVAVVALTLGVALYVWGAPIAADWIASRVPPSWDASLGQSVAERLAPPGRQCGDSAQHAAIGGILERLLKAGVDGRAAPYTFRMVVLRDTVVNAFAAPGGFIAVNSGLLKAARTPEEFAGVLAHEISHVTKRHSTRAIIREMPLRLAISAVAGGSGVEGAASFVGSLGALRYRRGDEAEADREGMRLLNAAQVDPAGVVSFMRTLEARGANAPRLMSYLTSHPHTADRVAALEAMARERRYEPRPLLDAATWERVRRICD